MRPRATLDFVSPMGIDDPICLSDLLEPRDLRDVLHCFARMHGVPLSVVECKKDGTRVMAATEHSSQAAVESMGSQIGPVHLRLESGDGSLAPELVSGLYVVPLMHHGDMIAKVAVGPYNWTSGEEAEQRDRAPEGEAGESGVSDLRLDDDQAGTIARHVAQVLEILVHNAHARFAMSAMHTEAMEVNFAELSAKNERLEKAVERMQEVDRLKSSFLATMSHELRTPLTSVIGYSEMLLEGLAGELRAEQREYMGTILSKAEQLLQLISGILDVSMLESGSLEMRRDPVAVPELVESIIATVRPNLRKRRIKLDKLDNCLPNVVGDRQKIRDIVRNLLANAIKFTPEGGTIHVSLEVGSLRPDDLDNLEDTTRSKREFGLQVIIADSGIGISPDEQEHIFEPFFQVDSSSTRAYGGTGLGLTLAKRYVEALGGHIWVESTLGSGSAFTVSFPVVPEDLRRFFDALGREAGQSSP